MDRRTRTASILIVDDDAGDGTLNGVLRGSGFCNTHHISDPRKAPSTIRTLNPDAVLLNLRMPLLDGIQVMRLARSREGMHGFLPILVVSDDASQETKLAVLGEGVGDYLSIPINHAEVLLRTRGMLRLRFLHLDTHVHQRRLAGEVSEQTLALEQAYQEIVGRLAKAVEYRDDGTGEHTRRVGDLSAQIARVLGRPGQEVEMIRVAAQLHDVGKTGIADNILFKPGKLTADEFATIKTHVDIGAAILGRSEAPLLKLAEQIVLTHHERWDGTGYPCGLVGEQIPIAGRIVAVTDVFDALTHERPYKEAWSVQKALAEICSLSGTHFDPKVVEALLTALFHESKPALAAA